MKIFNLSLFVLFTLFNTTIHAEEAVCKKCQIIREFNEKHPSKYEFYEDYLKDKANGVADETHYTDEASSPQN